MTNFPASDAARAVVSRYLYFGLYQRLRAPDVVAARQELEAHCTLDPEEIEHIQRRKLQSLIQHAYRHVPYYQRVFDERGLRPEDIREAGDLHQIPVLTKEIIQDQLENLRARILPASHGKASVNHTGGSTGQPLTFYQDAHYRATASANLDRTFGFCGWEPGRRSAFLWGSDADAQALSTLRGRAAHWGRNQIFLNTFVGTESEMAAFARQIGHFHPHLLVGYVSSLTTLADVVREHGIEGVRPWAIQSAAETLTPEHRHRLASIFECEVFNRYGCREVANIAHECSAHRGLHILTDLHVVEVLKSGLPATPGESGLLVITNLDNYAMPFIRYQIGDVGVPSDESCSCGLPFPLLADVQGRVTDIITSPSGRLIHGEFFTHLFYGVAGVRQFQVVQDTLENLQVRVVAGPDFDVSSLHRLESMIQRFGDPAFRVETHLVDHIAASPSGKFRFTMSKVPPTLTGEEGTRT